MRKGQSYSVIGIIAMLGVLGIAIWSAMQLSVGPGYESGIIQRTQEDAAIAKLETTKALIEQTLKFGSITGSMDVSLKGGTREAVTYWYCNGEPTPPEFEEVSFALSNTSLNYLNAYIKTLKEKKEYKELGISVAEYDCSTIIAPQKSTCLQSDCPSFGSGVTGGFIDVSKPARATYSGSIQTDNQPIRFWMVYYRLYDYFKSNQIMSVIADAFGDQCPGPESTHEKALVALEEVCDDIERLLDPQYVTCEVKILCEPDDLSCINAPCERYFDEELCYSTAMLEGETERTISLQGVLATERGKFIITDNKFYPTGTGPMVWNIYWAIPIEDQECIPID